MTGVKSDSISEKTTERSVLRFFSPLIATMSIVDVRRDAESTVLFHGLAERKHSAA